MGRAKNYRKNKMARKTMRMLTDEFALMLDADGKLTNEVAK